MVESDIKRIVRMLYPGPGWQNRARKKTELYNIFNWATGLPCNDLSEQERVDLIIETYGDYYWSQLKHSSFNYFRPMIMDLVTRIILNKRGDNKVNNEYKPGEILYCAEAKGRVKVTGTTTVTKDVRFISLDGSYADVLPVDKFEKIIDQEVKVGEIYTVKGFGPTEVVGYDYQANQVIVKLKGGTDYRRYSFSFNEFIIPKENELISDHVYEVRINGGHTQKVRVVGIDKDYVFFIFTNLSTAKVHLKLVKVVNEIFI